MTTVFRIALGPAQSRDGRHRRQSGARPRRARAQARDADVILFSELFITGYPPEDLVLKPALQDDAREAVEELARDTADGGPAILIGAPWVEDGKLYNAVLLLDGGKIAGRTFKHDLPNYGVFDEKRVFAPGPLPGPLNVRGVRLGVPVCEDIWTRGCHRMPGRDRRARFCWCPTARPSRPARKMCACNLVGGAGDAKPDCR